MGKGKGAGACLGVAGLLMDTGRRSTPAVTHGNSTMALGCPPELDGETLKTLCHNLGHDLDKSS